MSLFADVITVNGRRLVKTEPMEDGSEVWIRPKATVRLHYETLCALHLAILENQKLEPMELRHEALWALTEAISEAYGEKS